MSNAAVDSALSMFSAVSQQKSRRSKGIFKRKGSSSYKTDGPRPSEIQFRPWEDYDNPSNKSKNRSKGDSVMNTVRIVPWPESVKGDGLFRPVWTSEFGSFEERTLEEFTSPRQNGEDEACPFTIVAERLAETAEGTNDQEMMQEAERLLPSAKAVVPVIIRGHEDKGVLLWKLKTTFKNNGTFDQIADIFARRGDISDVDETFDLEVKHTKGSGVTITIDPDRCPLLKGEDEDVDAQIEEAMSEDKFPKIEEAWKVYGFKFLADKLIEYYKLPAKELGLQEELDRLNAEFEKSRKEFAKKKAEEEKNKPSTKKKAPTKKAKNKAESSADLEASLDEAIQATDLDELEDLDLEDDDIDLGDE